MHKQQGWPQAWEYCQAKLIQTLGGLDKEWTEAGVSIKSHHAQTSSGKGYQATSETETCQKHLTWAKEKKNWTVAQWSKVIFSNKSKCGRHRIKSAWSPVWSFRSQWWIWGAVTSAGVGPLCFIKSKVNAAVYQEILENFMLLSADKLYGDADLFFQ